MAKQGIRSLMSPQEANSAIYLDYEGNIGREPVLLGWMIDGALYGDIIDPQFQTCAHRYRAKHIGFANHRDLVMSLLERADAEGRLVVSWSEHDYWILMSQLDCHGLKRLRRIYRNAIPSVKRWHWYAKGSAATDGSLSHFMTLMGYQVPDRYGQHVVGNALRIIRTQLEQGRAYAELTGRARTGWQQVVRHNMHDLQAMTLAVHEASHFMDGYADKCL